MTCDKESFPKYTDGIVKLKHMNSRKGRHRYRLYKCPKCGNFHITTITKNLTTPKKMNKYPIDMEKQGSSKMKNIPGIKPIPQVIHPAHQQLATSKLLTKTQADILKHIIEAKNKQP